MELRGGGSLTESMQGRLVVNVRLWMQVCVGQLLFLQSAPMAAPICFKQPNFRRAAPHIGILLARPLISPAAWHAVDSGLKTAAAGIYCCACTGRYLAVHDEAKFSL